MADSADVRARFKYSYLEELIKVVFIFSFFSKMVVAFIQQLINHILQGCSTRSYEGHDPVWFSDLSVRQHLMVEVVELPGRKENHVPHRTGLHIPDVSCQAKPATISPPNIFFDENGRWGPISVYYTTHTAASMLPCVVCHPVSCSFLSHQSLCSCQHPDNATARLPPWEATSFPVLCPHVETGPAQRMHTHTNTHW